MKIYGTVRVNGEMVPVTNLIDAAGEETDDINECVTAVAMLAEDKWITFEFENVGFWPLQ